MAILPPSPNWYCNHVASCTEDGIYVYAARSDVYVFDLNFVPMKFVSSLDRCHADRVTTVSVRGNWLYTASEDGKVKRWDWKNRKCTAEHSAHNKVKVTAGHHSYLQEATFATGDERGKVILWQLESGTCGDGTSSKISTPSATPLLSSAALDGSTIFSIAFSKSDTALLAAGTKAGTVFVLNYLSAASAAAAGDGRSVLQVLTKLKGHDDEIHSVVWAPRQPDQSTCYEKADSPAVVYCPYALASASKDRTLRLWSMVKQRCTATLHLPNSTSTRQQATAQRQQDAAAANRLWVTLSWQRPEELVSSSHGGQLLVWDVTQPSTKSSDGSGGDRAAAVQPQRTRWVLLDDALHRHTRIVFSASAWGSDCLVTTSMDRTVVVWDLRLQRAVQRLFTLGGFAYSVRSSPHDPGRLAVGVGDNMIRLWNLNESNMGYNVGVHWQGMRSKVTVVAWHPKQEGRLAYGTEDGRVGVLQPFNSRPPVVFSTFHQNMVYVVTWGPLYSTGHSASPEPANASCDNGSLAVYSVGDGVILLHDPRNPNADAIELNSLIERRNPGLERRIRSEISWDDAHSLIAIGNDDGSVLLLHSTDLALLCQVRVCQKLVNALRWYPHSHHSVVPGSACGAQKSSSRCTGWLAIGSNDDRIFVINSTPFVGHAGQTPQVLLSPLATLVGHQGRVTDVSWNTHEEGQLASASYDGTVMVWNVFTVSMLAVFHGHSGRVLSCLWSQMDSDIVYSGGDDFSVRKWHISENRGNKPADSQDRKTADDRKKKTAKKNAKKKTGSIKSTAAQEPDAATRPDACPNVVSVSDDTAAELLELLQLRKAQLLQSSATQNGSAAAPVGSGTVAVEGQNGSCPVQQEPKIERSVVVVTTVHNISTSHTDAQQLDSCAKPPSDVMQRTGSSSTGTCSTADPADGSTVANNIGVTAACATNYHLHGNPTAAESTGYYEEGKGHTRLGAMKPSAPKPSTVTDKVTSDIAKDSCTASLTDETSITGGSHRLQDVEEDTDRFAASHEDAVSTGQKRNTRKKNKSLVTAVSLMPPGVPRDAAAFLSQLESDCMYIDSARRSQQPNIDDAHLHLGVFCGKQPTQRFIDSEARRLLQPDGNGGTLLRVSHSDISDELGALQMLVWRGDVKEALLLAVSRGCLTDWLVSASAMISFECHIKHSEAYARQLAAAGLAQKAALYYLMCHKTRDAVNVLLEHGLYGDALCIAQSHLVEDDPLISDVHGKWALQLMRSGNHELAARSWMSCGQPLEAVRALCRRGDARCQLAAARLADSAGLDVEARIQAESVWRHALVDFESCPDWSLAECAAAVHPDRKAVQRKTVIYRQLVKRLLFCSPMLPTDSSSVMAGSGEESLFCAIVKEWLALDLMPNEDDTASNAGLTICSGALPLHLKLPELLLNVAEHLTTTFLYVLALNFDGKAPSGALLTALNGGVAKVAGVPLGCAETRSCALEMAVHQLLAAVAALANNGHATLAAMLELMLFTDKVVDSTTSTPTSTLGNHVAMSAPPCDPRELHDHDASLCESTSIPAASLKPIHARYDNSSSLDTVIVQYSSAEPAAGPESSEGLLGRCSALAISNTVLDTRPLILHHEVEVADGLRNLHLMWNTWSCIEVAFCYRVRSFCHRPGAASVPISDLACCLDFVKAAVACDHVKKSEQIVMAEMAAVVALAHLLRCPQPLAAVAASFLAIGNRRSCGITAVEQKQRSSVEGSSSGDISAATEVANNADVKDRSRAAAAEVFMQPPKRSLPPILQHCAWTKADVTAHDKEMALYPETFSAALKLMWCCGHDATLGDTVSHNVAELRTVAGQLLDLAAVLARNPKEAALVGTLRSSFHQIWQSVQ